MKLKEDIKKERGILQDPTNVGAKSDSKGSSGDNQDYSKQKDKEKKKNSQPVSLGAGMNNFKLGQNQVQYNQTNFQYPNGIQQAAGYYNTPPLMPYNNQVNNSASVNSQSNNQQFIPMQHVNQSPSSNSGYQSNQNYVPIGNIPQYGHLNYPPDIAFRPPGPQVVNHNTPGYVNQHQMFQGQPVNFISAPEGQARVRVPPPGYFAYNPNIPSQHHQAYQAYQMQQRYIHQPHGQPLQYAPYIQTKGPSNNVTSGPDTFIKNSNMSSKESQDIVDLVITKTDKEKKIKTKETNKVSGAMSSYQGNKVKSSLVDKIEFITTDNTRTKDENLLREKKLNDLVKQIIDSDSDN